MKKCLLIFSMLLSWLIVSAQTEEENTIRQQSANFSRFYMEGNFQAMADAYTDSAILMPPLKDVIIGKKAILEFWVGLPATSKLLLHKSEPEKIIIIGNEAHEYGYYFTESKKNDEEKKRGSAKYYIIWVKTKTDGWKMKMDMWNGRNPQWNEK